MTDALEIGLFPGDFIEDDDVRSLTSEVIYRLSDRSHFKSSRL